MFLFFISFFFLMIIVTCRLCGVYVGEDNDINVKVMITQLVWTIWTSLSAVRKRLLNLTTHSLTYSLAAVVCLQNFGHFDKLSMLSGWGLGLFLILWWSPSTTWAGLLIFPYHHQGCLNNPMFSNLGLCAAC